jgi:hypothetical protein
VRGLGSIPGWLLAPVAFVVLVTLRFVSLAPGNNKPEVKSAEEEGDAYGSRQVDTVHHS